ncbi:MAG: hypothetical protein FWF28_05380, partial [Micrococcales bacterium]|nr:hypothetical protein [Micrococcales bacterium]
MNRLAAWVRRHLDRPDHLDRPARPTHFDRPDHLDQPSESEALMRGSNGPRHRHGGQLPAAPVRARSGHRRVTVLIGAAVVTALAAGGIVVTAQLSHAANTTFTVTNTLVGTSTAAGNPANDADTNPGDGACLAVAGGCTLKAAIQEANAQYAANSTAGPFLINFDASVQGTPTAPTVMTWPTATTGWMQTAALSGQDQGAVYKITAPITVDLTGVQLGASSANTLHGSWFYVAGPNATIQNFWNGIYAAESAIVVGYQARNFTLTNGIWAPPNNNSERLLTMQMGVNGVTVTNVKLRGGGSVSQLNTVSSLGGYFNFTDYGPGGSGSGSGGFTNIALGPNIQIDQAGTSGGTCSATVATGCANSILGYDTGVLDNVATANGVSPITPPTNPKWGIVGFTFTGNSVNALASNVEGMCFASGTGGFYTMAGASDFTITDNLFTNIVGKDASDGFCNTAGSGTALIVLPRFLAGTNTISGNVFQSVAIGTAGLDQAIRYVGNAATANNMTPSNLTITNNYFDGWQAGAGVMLSSAGLVTMERNTFGPASGTQTAAAGVAEEYQNGLSAAAQVMVSNNSGGAPTSYYVAIQSTNQGIRTWYPVLAPASSAVTPTVGPPASTDIPLTDVPAQYASLPTCTVELQVQQGTATDASTQAVAAPVNLGVYWTAANDAEIYLGQAQVDSGTSATLAVQLPIGSLAYPVTGVANIVGSDGLPAPTVSFGSQSTVVNATTGTLTGNLRLQTQRTGLAQHESSQYSRWVPLGGTCSPSLVISQNATYDGTPANGAPTGAPAQAYSSMSRLRVFTITASTPLDAGDLAAAITVTGTAAGARVVSVTAVDGSGDMQFTVVTQADDSGTIALAIPANTVANAAGLTNATAATASTSVIAGTPAGTLGNTLAYVNPITVSPNGFVIVTGNPTGQTYTIAVTPGAPAPTADLSFTASTPAANPYPLTLSTNTPTIATGSTSVPVQVTAPPGDAPATGAADWISHTLSSSDPNYDGLLVPSVSLTVYSSDPYLTIQKQAFTGVSGPNNAPNVLATGTQVASGGQLTDGVSVWFVFHVCNISAQTAAATGQPTWVTALTNVNVTDDVLGTIGTIPLLDAG